MSKWLVVSLIAVLFAAVFFYREQSNAPEAPVPKPVPESTEAFVVTLSADGYDPAEFTIPVGTTVTFKSVTGKPHWPASDLHPTHEIYAAFDPQKPVDPDAEWSFTFDEVGDWDFHDHLRAYYTGTVHVVPR